jgi:CRISPR/Cas system-associated exonuclease Cas4 (RecB family)
MGGVYTTNLVDAFENWVLERQALYKTSTRPDEKDTHMIHTILRGYQERYEETDRDWQILAVEVPIRYKVPGTNIWLLGTVDLIVKYKGYVWIVDHKFLKAIGANLAQQLEMDDQMTGYLWLAKQHGIDARGCIYNVIKKKAPTVPPLLKSGALSQRGDMDTTYDVYMQAIKDNGLNPDNYAKFLDTLVTKPLSFYHRETVVRNKHELNMFERDLPWEVRDMTSTSTHLYPSPGMQCGWCKFRSLCKCEREGGDAAYTRKHLYRLKEYDER